MRNRIECIFVLLIAVVTSVQAESPATRPTTSPADKALPLNVFRNLNAGRPQTVIVYGTSLTIRGAWAKSLKDYFDDRYPNQVTLVNAAKAGMDSKWGVENVADRVLSKKPDMVFIEFAINDAAKKNTVSVEKCEVNLGAIVHAIRAQNPQADIVLQTMNPAWDSPRMKDVKYGTDRPELALYYDVYRKYAREHDLPLVDNYTTWLKYQKEDPGRFEKMVPDGIHPSSTASVGVTWPAVEAVMEEARAAAK